MTVATTCPLEIVPVESVRWHCLDVSQDEGDIGRAARRRRPCRARRGVSLMLVESAAGSRDATLLDTQRPLGGGRSIMMILLAEIFPF